MAIFTSKTKSSQKVLSKKDMQEVQKIAYQLYVNRGYQHGHDKEDWKKAEQIVLSKQS